MRPCRSQPAEAMDPEIAGQIAAIGIVKGKPFKPDARMKKILTEALAVGNAVGRVMSLGGRPSEGFGYYGADSKWVNGLFVGGYEFMTPPPEITKEGIKPYPNDGARKLNARLWMFYSVTGITPAMCMRLENIGSQYLENFRDSQGNPFDGSKTYKVTLPPKIPAARFWSFTVYDNQTPFDARHAATLSARGQPKLSVASRRGERRRIDNRLLFPGRSPTA